MTPPPKDAPKAPCPHPHKRRCGLCGENYCPNDGCDPYHVQGCRDAMKP